MALIYFYDASDIDKTQLSEGLAHTDHYWKYVEEKISIDNIDPAAEVISVFVSSTVTSEMIERMPNLRLIACRSTGFNNVDMEAANAHDVTVVNVPTYGESTVAEYAFTLLLALTRKLEKTLDVADTQYDPRSLIGEDLCGKTIGIVGTGHIGQHTIKIANGFSMRVIAHDAFPIKGLDKELGFEYVELDELLRQSDVISLHLPLLPATKYIINTERLALMKSEAILINTARGELVDTNALVGALHDKQIGGAALDVVEGEALLNHEEEMALLRSEEIDEKLLKHSLEISELEKMDNVLITPHNAFNTTGAVGRINGTTAKNIIDFWYGEVPNKVQPPTPEPGKLVIVRHTESEWNATGQWTGQTDINLDDKGFDDSVASGRLLKKLDIDFDIAYCSEQIRTRETMHGLLSASDQFDVEVVRESAINERDYGDYTGKNKWEIEQELGSEHFHAIRRGWDVPIPNGETLKMVYERAVPFYKNTVVPQLEAGKNVLIVGHGNSIRALIKYIEDLSDDEIGKTEMLFGEILVYDVDSEGHMQHKHIELPEITETHA